MSSERKTAQRNDGLWYFPFQGVAEIVMKKSNGEVINIFHGK